MFSLERFKQDALSKPRNGCCDVCCVDNMKVYEYFDVFLCRSHFLTEMQKVEEQVDELSRQDLQYSNETVFSGQEVLPYCNSV